MRHWLKYSYLAAIYGFLYFPIGVLIVYSFNASEVASIWQGFTWRWYTQLLHNHRLLRIVFHSLLLAFTSSTAATVLGVLAAVTLYRYRFYGSQFLYLLLFILMLSPEIVMAVGLLLLFAWTNISLGFWSLLLAHTTFCMPFVSMSIYSHLVSLDRNIIKAAKELGATEVKIFMQIILPWLKMSILSGWLLSFTLSLDDVMISFFLSGPTFTVLPVEIYSWVRLGVKPELNALCTILLGVTLVLIVSSQVLLGRKRD